MDRRELLVAFGATVARRRRALGQTQESLAERTGLHRTYVGSVERGERNPTLTSVTAIAAGLECRADELLAETLAGGL